MRSNGLVASLQCAFSITAKAQTKEESWIYTLDMRHTRGFAIIELDYMDEVIILHLVANLRALVATVEYGLSCSIWL